MAASPVTQHVLSITVLIYKMKTLKPFSAVTWTPSPSRDAIFSLLFPPAAALPSPAPTALAPSSLTLVAVRHGGSPHPVGPALDPLVAPQHVAGVALKLRLVPKGVFGFAGAELSAVADGRAGTPRL